MFFPAQKKTLYKAGPCPGPYHKNLNTYVGKVFARANSNSTSSFFGAIRVRAQPAILRITKTGGLRAQKQGEKIGAAAPIFYVCVKTRSNFCVMFL